MASYAGSSNQCAEVQQQKLFQLGSSLAPSSISPTPATPAARPPCCHEGFYHADPHPGNLLRTADGRLAYLDFGMMGQIDSNIRR